MRVPPTRRRAQYPLDSALSTHANVRVLRELLLSDGPVSAGFLSRTTLMSAASIRQALEGLRNSGYVRPLGDRSQLWESDSGHPLHQQLTTLFKAEKARWVRVIEDLKANLASRPGAVGGYLFDWADQGTTRDLLSAVLILRDEDNGAKADEDTNKTSQNAGPQVTVVVYTVARLARVAATNTDEWKRLCAPCTPLFGAATVSELLALERVKQKNGLKRPAAR